MRGKSNLELPLLARDSKNEDCVIGIKRGAILSLEDGFLALSHLDLLKEIERSALICTSKRLYVDVINIFINQLKLKIPQLTGQLIFVLNTLDRLNIKYIEQLFNLNQKNSRIITRSITEFMRKGHSIEYGLNRSVLEHPRSALAQSLSRQHRFHGMTTVLIQFNQEVKAFRLINIPIANCVKARSLLIIGLFFFAVGMLCFDPQSKGFAAEGFWSIGAVSLFAALILSALHSRARERAARSTADAPDAKAALRKTSAAAYIPVLSRGIRIIQALETRHSHYTKFSSQLSQEPSSPSLR